MGNSSEESVPHHLAFETGDAFDNNPFESDDGTIAAIWSTAEYVGEQIRDKRKCFANDHTCKAWKSGGTDYCVGHNKKIEKKLEEVADAE
jgi:hypothetical protein